MNFLSNYETALNVLIFFSAQIPEIKVIKVPYKVPVYVKEYIPISKKKELLTIFKIKSFTQPIVEEKHYEHKEHYGHEEHGYGKHDDYKKA